MTQLQLQEIKFGPACRVCGEDRQALTMKGLCWGCHLQTPEWAAQMERMAKITARWRAGRKEEETVWPHLV